MTLQTIQSLMGGFTLERGRLHTGEGPWRPRPDMYQNGGQREARGRQGHTNKMPLASSI